MTSLLYYVLSRTFLSKTYRTFSYRYLLHVRMFLDTGLGTNGYYGRRNHSYAIAFLGILGYRSAMKHFSAYIALTDKRVKRLQAKYP
jgi:hypothetical protein